MTTQPLLISKREAASLLGISVGMLDKLRRMGRLERVRLGRRVLFRRSDIEGLALTDRQKKTLAREISGAVQ
jgi:excisionase family DNA binding protein